MLHIFLYLFLKSEQLTPHNFHIIICLDAKFYILFWKEIFFLDMYKITVFRRFWTIKKSDFVSVNK